MRGVTLAEISESTKISNRWLKALEDEQFNLLPGGVFNRGFVRAYAHFLGINEDEAVADYIAASGEQPPPEDKFPLEIHEKPKAKTPALNPKRSIRPILLAVLALTLLVGGWTWWVNHKPVESAVKPQSNSQSSDFQAPDSAPERPSVTNKVNKQISTVAQRRSAPGATREIDINARSTDGQDLGGAFSVVIRARQNSWISIAVDGQPLWMGTLNANSERSVTAGKELVLKTGNAAGIDVSYNGRALGTLGRDKEVRTLTFNTAGLQQ